MARINKVDSKTNLAVPIQPIDGEDCFGLEYDSVAPECKMCGDFHACMSVFKKTLQKKSKSQNYLDTTDFNVIDRDKLAKILAQSNKEYDEVVSYCQSKANSTFELAEAWLDFLLSEYNLTVKNGIVCEK